MKSISLGRKGSGPPWTLSATPKEKCFNYFNYPIQPILLCFLLLSRYKFKWNPNHSFWIDHVIYSLSHTTVLLLLLLLLHYFILFFWSVATSHCLSFPFLFTTHNLLTIINLILKGSLFSASTNPHGYRDCSITSNSFWSRGI